MYLELHNKIKELFKEDLYKKTLSQYNRKFIWATIILMISIMAILGVSDKIQNANFSISIKISIIIILYIIVLTSMIFWFRYLMIISNIKSSFKFITENPIVILYTEKKYYDKLYMKKQIKKDLIEYIKTLPTEILDSSNISINENKLSFTITKNGRNFETTQFTKKSDTNGKRIQAHIVKENVIYGFMKGDIVNIILHNY